MKLIKIALLLLISSIALKTDAMPLYVNNYRTSKKPIIVWIAGSDSCSSQSQATKKDREGKLVNKQCQLPYFSAPFGPHMLQLSSGFFNPISSMGWQEEDTGAAYTAPLNIQDPAGIAYVHILDDGKYELIMNNVSQGIEQATTAATY